MLELDIKLKPSIQFIFILIILTIISFIAIHLGSFSQKNKLLLNCLIIFYSAYIFYKHYWTKSPYFRKRLITNGTEWYLEKKDGLDNLVLLGESTITKWVCILRYRLKDSRKKQTYLIFKDSIEKEQYRRLLVALRCTKLTIPQAKA